MATLRPWLAVVAGLLVAGMGSLIFFGGAPLIGGPLFVVGCGIAIWRGLVLWKSRPDPYDLSRLWDTDEPDDEPEEDVYVEDTVYCHNCGHAVTRPFARCPECGMSLR